MKIIDLIKKKLCSDNNYCNILYLNFLLGHYNNDYQNYNPGCQDYDHYGVHPGLSYYNSNNIAGQENIKLDGNAYHVYDTGVPPNQLVHEYNESIPIPQSPSACSESPPQQILAQGKINTSLIHIFYCFSCILFKILICIHILEILTIFKHNY